jgi:carbamoyl-phosphate synthase large subunit
MKNPLKIILTGVGCPGAMTMINALKSVKEREIYIIGTDTKENAAGRFFVDEFYTVPLGLEENYIPSIREIYKKTNADLILPQTSYEVVPLCRNKKQLAEEGINVLVSDEDSVIRGGDKWHTYEAVKNTSVLIPSPILVKSVEEFKKGIKTLGYPQNQVCFKPPYSKGSRGFRTISSNANRLDLLLNEKPGSMLITLDEAIDIFETASTFPDLILMKFIPGKEYTVDLYCKNGEILCGFTKTREAIRDGLAMYFETVDRPDLWKSAAIVVKKLNLSNFVNVQFKDNVLLEVNPRVSTFIHQDNFNMPYLGIKHFLGEISDEEIREYSKNVNTSRRTVRFYDQVFYNQEDLESKEEVEKVAHQL